MFLTNFDRFACIGDSIHCTVSDTVYTAYIVQDLDTKIDDDDCHNTDQSATGCTDDQFETLLTTRQAWFDGEWCYVGVVISAERGEWTKDNLASLWGIEMNYPNSTNDYLATVANELLSEILENE